MYWVLGSNLKCDPRTLLDAFHPAARKAIIDVDIPEAQQEQEQLQNCALEISHRPVLTEGQTKQLHLAVGSASWNRGLLS